MTKPEKRFGYRALPDGGAEFRVRDTMGFVGCLMTFVLGIFGYHWVLGALRLFKDWKERSLDTNGAFVLAVFVPCMIFLWFMGPNTLFYRTLIVVSGGRLKVLRWFRWKDAAVDDIASIERFVHQSTSRKDDPRETTSVYYACRIRLKDGSDIVFGHNHEAEDLDWLASKLSSCAGLKPLSKG